MKIPNLKLELHPQVWLGGQRIENNKTDGFIVDPKNNNTFERSKPEFAWQDGSPFDYSEWRFSCPDTKRDEKCILMSIFQSRSVAFQQTGQKVCLRNRAQNCVNGSFYRVGNLPI